MGSIESIKNKVSNYMYDSKCYVDMFFANDDSFRVYSKYNDVHFKVGSYCNTLNGRVKITNICNKCIFYGNNIKLNLYEKYDGQTFYIMNKNDNYFL